MSLFNSIDIYIEKFITILFIYYNFFIYKLNYNFNFNFNFNKNKQIENEILFDNKTQKEVNALLEKYTKETLKHLNKLKHHACYNEMLDLITFSKIRKI